MVFPLVVPEAENPWSLIARQYSDAPDSGTAKAPENQRLVALNDPVLEY
jgi:hypothetical protein